MALLERLPHEIRGIKQADNMLPAIGKGLDELNDTRSNVIIMIGPVAVSKDGVMGRNNFSPARS
jgi:hypothetical protein